MSSIQVADKTTLASTRVKTQVRNGGVKAINYHGTAATLSVQLRYDDECGNGHNSFSITGTVTERGKSRNAGFLAGGCLHEEIAQHFPELAPFIKWHLCSSDGPMHYVANTVYHAGDRDCNGLLAEEKRQIVNGRTKELCWRRVAVSSTGEEIEIYELDKNVDGPTAPTDIYTIEWRPWCRVGEGKPRELDAARNAAIWPDATDEELTAPGLRERLENRLPALLVEFRTAMESLGFVW